MTQKQLIATSSTQSYEQAIAEPRIATPSGLFGYRLRPPTHYEPNRRSLFVPGAASVGDSWRLTFGRPPHRRLWRGCAALLAGGEALPACGGRGTQRNLPGRFRRRWHLRGMERKAPPANFFTERTLADFLAVSDRTVRNWIRRGELPSYKLGAARRIDPADVEDFLARHRDEAS